MSSVSSVGNSNLMQWLQQLTGQTGQSTPTTTATSATDPTQSLALDPSATAGASATPHHHHHHGMGQKIESSVTSALKDAPSGSDPNQVIKDAITQALGGKPGATGTDPDGDGDGSTSSTSAAGAANATTSSQAAFSQLLASYGVSSQQFQQDLQDALPGQSGQSSPDFATLFRSFPPGSLLQATG